MNGIRSWTNGSLGLLCISQVDISRSGVIEAGTEAVDGSPSRSGKAVPGRGASGGGRGRRKSGFMACLWARVGIDLPLPGIAGLRTAEK